MMEHILEMLLGQKYISRQAVIREKVDKVSTDIESLSQRVERLHMAILDGEADWMKRCFEEEIKKNDNTKLLE